MFCCTISEEGMIIGKIEDITVKNEYYKKPQTVKNFNSGSPSNINTYFPSDKWEDHLGYVKVLGVFPFDNGSFFNSNDHSFSNIIKRSAFPAKPGSKVFVLEGDRLTNFLGINKKDGLNIGNLEHYDLDLKLDINRLVNKHFAILAMSGAGKSYLISVLLEEFLLRNSDMGTPGVLLIDVHGEYKFLSDPGIPENKEIAMKTTYYDAKYFQIDVSNLNAYDIANYQPNISRAQIRELKKVIDGLRKQNDDKGKKIGYNLSDIIKELEKLESINKKVRNALIGWLFELERLNLFYKTQNPVLRKIIIPNHLCILDLSSIISMKKKQIIVSYLAEKLFYMRRREKVPPFLFILEEAHQFAPEGGLNSSHISKRIIETIAREGRKFYGQICLISQRPVKLSTTALSQCNTHIIMKLTNPNDLDHIKTSSEALTRDSLRSITTLPTGNALIMGAAVNFPIFLQVRKRYTSNSYDDEKLEDVCKRFN
ncbi:MAG: ATP-binding protein [Promethearchaeota archaeon]